MELAEEGVCNIFFFCSDFLEEIGVNQGLFGSFINSTIVYYCLLTPFFKHLHTVCDTLSIFHVFSYSSYHILNLHIEFLHAYLFSVKNVKCSVQHSKSLNYICEKCVVGIIRRYGRQIPIVTLMLSSKRRTKKKDSSSFFFLGAKVLLVRRLLLYCSVFSLGSRTLKVNDAS